MGLELEKVKEEICDIYCKYPSEYLAEYNDPDDANTAMLEEVCRNCPLERL